MQKNKQGGISLLPLVALLFGSVVFASATLLNSTDNVSNGTIDLNLTLNNVTVDNTTLPGNISTNENATNATQEITANAVAVEDIIEKNKHKLNNKTKDFLKTSADKTKKDDFIVKFKNNIDDSKLSKVKIEERFERFKAVEIEGKLEDAEELLDDAEVEFIELDEDIRIIGAFSNYTDIIEQNIIKTKAIDAWNLTKGDKVKIAILDTGIAQHQDLVIAGGTSVISVDYNDTNGHGTAVAGIISAVLNNAGIAGMAPKAEIYSVKIMEGSAGKVSDAIKGIEWAMNNNMSIVTMSFGTETYSQIFKDVLQEAYNNSILLIAGSGNNGQDNILYPARYSSVIAVGAVDNNNEKASFSSYGFELELAAPGVDITSTTLNNGYALFTGTSISAPHVAGAAALIKAYNNSLTNDEIRAKLRNDALDLGDAGKDKFYGYGLVQVNLTSYNFTLANLSYFYEIFNISWYGLTNETYLFFVNGTGTIDDVDFGLGYYLVNITFDDGNKKSDEYFVDENGTLILLAGPYIQFYDNYTFNCPSSPYNCSGDGVVWKNWEIKYRNNKFERDTYTVKAECYYRPRRQNAYDKCWGTQANINSCRASHASFDMGCDNLTGDPCSNPSGSLGEYSLTTSSSIAEEMSGSACYTSGDFDTLGTGSGGAAGHNIYKVCYQRQFVCSSATQYVDKCWAQSGTGYIIEDQGPGVLQHAFATYDCPVGTTCDYNLDEANADFGIYGTTLPSAPCVSQTSTCNGTISAIATDSKSNPLSTLQVFFNNVYNGSTDTDGAKEIVAKNVACGVAQNITMKCSDNITICGTKSAPIDNTPDYDSLSFSCNVCINKKDLSIKSSDVSIKSQGSSHNITALINIEKATASNIQVVFRGQKNDGTITQTATKTISVSDYVNQNVSVFWDLSSTDFVSISVDSTNIVAESDEGNNYVKKPTRPLTKAYIDVSTDYPILNLTIISYLEQYIDYVSEANAEVKIYVGRKNPNIPNSQTLNTLEGSRKWSKTDNIVSFNTKREGLPYNGLVVKDNTKIYILGNEIDGDIAALRKLVDNREFYFSKSVPTRIDYVSEEDLTGLFVFDYMHTDENQAKYRKNNDNFAQVLEER